jgi:hypothetical protein
MRASEKTAPAVFSDSTQRDIRPKSSTIGGQRENGEASFSLDFFWYFFASRQKSTRIKECTVSL